jgi:hypothetical protein
MPSSQSNTCCSRVFKAHHPNAENEDCILVVALSILVLAFDFAPHRTDSDDEAIRRRAATDFDPARGCRCLSCQTQRKPAMDCEVAPEILPGCHIRRSEYPPSRGRSGRGTGFPLQMFALEREASGTCCLSASEWAVEARGFHSDLSRCCAARTISGRHVFPESSRLWNRAGASHSRYGSTLKHATTSAGRQRGQCLARSSNCGTRSVPTTGEHVSVFGPFFIATVPCAFS